MVYWVIEFGLMRREIILTTGCNITKKKQVQDSEYFLNALYTHTMLYPQNEIWIKINYMGSANGGVLSVKNIRMIPRAQDFPPKHWTVAISVIHFTSVSG